MDIKNRVDLKNYPTHVLATMPKSPVFSSCIKAFFVGGGICALGEAIFVLGEQALMLAEDDARAFTSVTLIFLGALLTGLGVYDVLGRFAGAGSILPITGFANSIVAPAMEFKHEGFVMGVGAKLFSVAGPVLVYGIASGVLAGAITYVISLF